MALHKKYSKVWRILFENTWYMKFCSRTKCWQVTLRFNCHNKFPFFQKRISYFQICYLLTTEWPLFFLKYPDHVNFYIYTSICYFNFFIISVLVIPVIFFNILPDFSANTFFTLSSLQTIIIYAVFSDPANNFQYFSPPTSRKRMVCHLLFWFCLL